MNKDTMKNTLAENMLRFGPRKLTESEKRKLSKLVEQTDAKSLNLGKTLNELKFQDGVYELNKELQDVNILMSTDIDSATISSNDPEFAGAYARPLFLLINQQSMFFIGRSMVGGSLHNNKQWSVEPGYKIVKPSIDTDGYVTKGSPQQEVLNTNSAKAAYMQIYKFNMKGYRNNEQITKLVQLLESKGIIPNLKEEISNSAYSMFLQNQHDSAMNTIARR